MRAFTVLGPSQSGKTELVKRLAALDGTPAKHETAAHLSFTRFGFMSENWVAIDLAGGPEFARMAGAALAASDAAVLCVGADPEEAVLAAPYLRAIDDAGLPCLIFINRMDLPKGRVRDIVAALQAYTNHSIVLRQVPIREGGRIVGAVDLISERAWRYREGQTSVLVEMPADLRGPRGRGAGGTAGEHVGLRRQAAGGAYRRPRAAVRRALLHRAARNRRGRADPGLPRRSQRTRTACCV